jgi:hypothetical protein
MNVTQYKSPGRRADLSPFGVHVAAETPPPAARIRNAGVGDIRKGVAETDSRFGCVDWYHYANTDADGPGADLRNDE